eukprot:TRINITY_DN2836_c0_g1_i9.p1 TRINITY_DN2836_c0_g1~~TRINITY_DN2836_c0_g1_i9.p1  ORF type:complete len:202 (+),score=29.80 TRINITY_DN2836_c0_g1_i9:47-652(+)
MEVIKANWIIVTHALMLCASWLILVPLGMFIARFWNPSTKGFLRVYTTPHWFQFHTSFMLVGMLASVVGTLFAMMHVADDERPHFQGGHRALGFFVNLVAFFQPWIGFMAQNTWDNPNRQRIYWASKVHNSLGFACYSLASVNIFLGLQLVNAHVFYYVVAGLVIGATVVVFLLQESRVIIAAKRRAAERMESYVFRQESH